MQKIWPVLIAAAMWILLSPATLWAQTTPAPDAGKKDGAGEKTDEEKMKAGGSQEPDRMQRKKGEEEMEARGAQKPGRMGKSGTAGTERESGESRSNPDIRKAQQALKNRGHNPGAIDGVMGSQTRAAIKAFQRANGLKETGDLDTQTAEKLAGAGK